MFKRTLISQLALAGRYASYITMSKLWGGRVGGVGDVRGIERCLHSNSAWFQDPNKNCAGRGRCVVAGTNTIDRKTTNAFS